MAFLKPERLAALAGVTVALACTPPPPAVGPAPPAVHETEQSHLLVFPVSDAAGLLGRAVQPSEDGGWTIASARAAGCEVAVRHEKAAFHTRRQADMHSLTAVSGSYARLLSLEASFGRSNTADIDIANTEILRADTRGACGEHVIDTVFVGHGKRSLLASANGEMHGGGALGVVGAAGSSQSGAKILDAIDWSDDQAYGYTYSTSTKTEPLRIGVTVPSVVTEGDEVSIRFEAKSRAYLVVYYLEGNGQGGVLWPSNEEPKPMAEPGHVAVLPSPAEIKQGFSIKAALSKRGEEARETLVVYGFADEQDFDALKPNAGEESANGAASIASLTAKLDSIPMSRWSRTVVGYLIRPKG